MFIRHKRYFASAEWLLIGLCLLLVGCGSGDPEPAEAPVVTTPSGLVYQDLKAGHGEAAAAGQTVAVHYTGWITEGGRRGQRIGATHAGGQPFVFRLGRGEVIKGWDEGVVGMRVGGVRRLTVPPPLVGYSAVTGSPIPPDATLIFEVELVEIRR